MERQSAHHGQPHFPRHGPLLAHLHRSVCGPKTGVRAEVSSVPRRSGYPPGWYCRSM